MIYHDEQDDDLDHEWLPTLFTFFSSGYRAKVLEILDRRPRNPDGSLNTGFEHLSNMELVNDTRHFLAECRMERTGENHDR
jgi:hypothetical protein